MHIIYAYGLARPVLKPRPKQEQGVSLLAAAPAATACRFAFRLFRIDRMSCTSQGACQFVRRSEVFVEDYIDMIWTRDKVNAADAVYPKQYQHDARSIVLVYEVSDL